MSLSLATPLRRPAALDRIEPMLPSASAEPADSPDRIYEIKWDGIRAIAAVGAGAPAMHTRGGKDLTPAFHDVAAAVEEAVGGAEAVLDGELVILNDDGIPERHAVVDRWLGGSPKLPLAPVSYEIFDILRLNGRSLTQLPLYERKALLHDVVQPNSAVHLCHFEDGEGVAMFDAALELGLRGIVAKNKHSLYEPGKRTQHWLTVKQARTANLVVGGYTFGGAEQPFGALLLGAWDGARLRYVGSVAGGFARGGPGAVYAQISRLHAGACPFDREPELDRFSYWCEPSLVVEVEYGERTPDGGLRFLLFSSLRPDLAATDAALP